MSRRTNHHKLKTKDNYVEVVKEYILQTREKNRQKFREEMIDRIEKGQKIEGKNKTS